MTGGILVRWMVISGSGLIGFSLVCGLMIWGFVWVINSLDYQ